MSQLRECFGCEKLFEVIEPGQIYCSDDCSNEFEAALQTEIELAKQDGLITDEGTPTSASVPTLSASDLQRISNQFILKVNK